MGKQRRYTPPSRNLRHSPSLRSWGDAPPRTPEGEELPENVVVRCGWGRLVFGHTFRDAHGLVEEMRKEQPGQRDIALYLRDPHVLLSLAPQQLFLDPSHTFRMWLSEYRPDQPAPGINVRRMQNARDVAEANRVLSACRMVPLDEELVLRKRSSRTLVHLVAEDVDSGEILGTVTGVDHVEVFGDPEGGTSLWSLAVAPQARLPGVGEALTRHLVELFVARGRVFLDLSVMYDNRQAIRLYGKLGFRRVPVFCVKNKNAINEPLYANPHELPELNPYAMIIVREALKRGIRVEVVDEGASYFRLSHGARSILCRESLTELTSAVAMSRCVDKAVARRCVAREGIVVPPAQRAGSAEDNHRFLERHGRLVVKPATGEQGRGVTVDVRDPKTLDAAIEWAQGFGDEVLLEKLVSGQDLRLVVIGHDVVAAAVRKVPEVVGSGDHTVRQLVEKQSRRRSAATGGESTIPLDEETERVVASQGYGLDDVLPAGERIVVRRTANLHTGGTIHDVTDEVHPDLVDAAVRCSRALEIPVVGIDLVVPDVSRHEYAFIEANERVGLANHEPQPTAERFVDLLFPLTKSS